MKGKRTELSTHDCAIARSLDVIGDWWSLLIIRDARSGKRRFSEFHRNLGMAKNILATRLKKLVEREIMEKVPAADGSTLKEYVLTEKGERLFVVIVALWQWGEESCFEAGELRFVMADVRTGEPLARLKVQTESGKPIGARDFHLVARSVVAASSGADRASPRPGQRRQRSATAK